MASRQPSDPTHVEIPTSGTLYIAPLSAHAESAIRACLGDTKVPFSEPHQGILAVDLEPGGLGELCGSLIDRLTDAELQSSMSVVVANGSTATISDVLRMRSLGTLIARAQRQWLSDLVEQGRLLSVFQPIVHIDSARVFAYECLLRGRDTNMSLISPKRIFTLARLNKLLPFMDSVAFETALSCASRNHVDVPIFVNFHQTSIGDGVFDLSRLMGDIAAHQITPDDIVFELVESDHANNVSALRDILVAYRKAGFRIALDDVGAGYSSLNLMAFLKPDYIKLDMDLIRDVHRDRFKSELAAKLLEAARNLDVATIAEGVESEGEWRWLAAHGADYAQGFLFARPASPPPVPHWLAGQNGHHANGTQSTLHF